MKSQLLLALLVNLISANVSGKEPRKTTSTSLTHLPISVAVIDMRDGIPVHEQIVFDIETYKLDETPDSTQFPKGRRYKIEVTNYTPGKRVFTFDSNTKALSDEHTHINCSNHGGEAIPPTVGMIEACLKPAKVIKYKVTQNGVESPWHTN